MNDPFKYIKCAKPYDDVIFFAIISSSWCLCRVSNGKVVTKQCFGHQIICWFFRMLHFGCCLSQICQEIFRQGKTRFFLDFVLVLCWHGAMHKRQRLFFLIFDNPSSTCLQILAEFEPYSWYADVFNGWPLKIIDLLSYSIVSGIPVTLTRVKCWNISHHSHIRYGTY